MNADEEKNAQLAALLENVIEALHEDERIDLFLYFGENLTEALMEDVSFHERVTCVQLGLEEAINGQELSGIFNRMLACAQQKNIARDVPEAAFEAIKEHAQDYRDGKYKPQLN